jgi:hypothetical protein
MLYFLKLKVLNHGFYGLWGFTAVGGRLWFGFGALSARV